MNEVRRDYLLDRRVIVAENRGSRPHDFIQAPPPLKEGKAARTSCVFCPGKERLTPPETGRIGAKGSGWLVRSFYNKFPAVSSAFPKAQGSHEVIVETPHHHLQMSQLPVPQIARALQLCATRQRELESGRRTRYVLIFKNQGAPAGTSLMHSHMQLIATPDAPPLLSRELEAFARAKRRGGCPFCRALKAEEGGPRLVAKDRHFIAFAPFASRSAFEVWLVPRRHVRSLAMLDAAELRSLAGMLKRILSRLDSLFKYPSFNYYLHSAPAGEDFHFHIELLPRLTVWAGFELGSETYINPVSPEKAAAALRHGKHY